MKMKVTAVTVELNKLVDDDFTGSIKELTTKINDNPGDVEANSELNSFLMNSCIRFCGRNAGICYASDSYDNQKIFGDVASEERFLRTIINTHHSIADHCNITVLFENVPKIFAMIMNSFRFYTTSEKSARYTVMDNLSEEEAFLYNKWRMKLKDVICNDLGYHISEKQAEKIANENARYFISVFTPATTFSYTTSFRQWNYINQWFMEFNELNEMRNDMRPVTKRFLNQLNPLLGDFNKSFQETFIYDRLIKDPKSRRIGFLTKLYPSSINKICDNTYYKDSYTIKYRVSFSSLAQLQRHRTIKYVINGFLLLGKPAFFIPEFIRSTPLRHEWVEDMLKVEDKFPQGMRVEVIEYGTIDDFLLKCDERLCGRVQYETMKCVSDQLLKFYKKDKLSNYYKAQVSEWIDDTSNPVKRVKSKCEMRHTGCLEGGCIHGPYKATDRKF